MLIPTQIKLGEKNNEEFTPVQCYNEGKLVEFISLLFFYRIYKLKIKFGVEWLLFTVGIWKKAS